MSNVDLNAGGGFVDASTARLVFTPNSTSIVVTTVVADVDVVRYASLANVPWYLVQRCTSTGNTVCRLCPSILSNTQLSGLVGYFKASNTDADDVFGNSIALSGDGTTLAVGARFEDSPETGINGSRVADNNASNAGAVYLY